MKIVKREIPKPKADDEYLQQRRKELKKVAFVRQQTIMGNEQLKFTRDTLFNTVSKILHQHILEAQRLIPKPTEAALLFHEHNFVAHEWHIYSAAGYSSTMPLFYFHFDEVPYQEVPCERQDITKFLI